MNRSNYILFSFFALSIVVISCRKNTPDNTQYSSEAISRVFGNTIDINNPENYANQNIPSYILAENGQNNPIDDRKATLGRVLFYDKKLSINNTISCGSCHQQQFAFSDTARQSTGVNGVTNRHSMRLINTRFARESKFFWNERAASLETQTTMPIQDHAEMGYSGQNGDPNLSDLINKLNGLDYYLELVAWAYQDPKKTKKIDENTLQECLSQFIRSIQSFDSKYDQGRSQLPLNANNDNLPNFTTSENNGRALFTNPPTFNDTGLRIAGGLGCGGCHRAPEFDIDPNSRNNGFVGNNENPNILDLGNTRSPTLRDAVNQNGIPNGPFMHTGVQTSLAQVMGHYGRIQVRPGNNNIDPRLTPRGFPQRLNLTTQERADVIAFLETLSGNSVYTDKRCSDPFN